MKTVLLITGFSAAVILSAPALAAPDLIPDASDLTTNGTVAVVNQGADAAGPTVATVVCEPAPGDQCPEAASMAAYENMNHPNAAAIQVPALEPGGVYLHDLAFWGDLDWQPGTYTLILSVDAAASVGESNEANNTVSVDKIQAEVSVGGGTSAIGGFTDAPSGQPGGGQGADDIVLVGQPDIIGTALGFHLGDHFIKWGGTGELTLMSAVEQTEGGPDGDLCILHDGVFRPFNKGPIATGAFTTIVTRDATTIYSFETSLAPFSTQDENSGWEAIEHFPVHEGINVVRVYFDVDDDVEEADENNVFMVRLIVKLDCDGDGVVGSALPKIKQKRPEKPERPGRPSLRTPSPSPTQPTPVPREPDTPPEPAG